MDYEKEGSVGKGMKQRALKIQMEKDNQEEVTSKLKQITRQGETMSNLLGEK